MAGNSSVDALSAAWEAAENSTDEAAPDAESGEQEGVPESPLEATPEAEPAPLPQAQAAPTQGSVKAPEAGGKKPTPTAPKPGKTGKGAPATQEQPAKASEAPGFKPPQSWPPAVRELYKDLPNEVKAAIDKREKDTLKALSANAVARKVADAFGAVLTPYMPHLQATGVEPVEAVQRLFQTEYVLRTGNPAQKAQLLAGLIQGYGVDVAALAAALEGKQPEAPAPAQPQAQHPKPEDFRDPRFDALMTEAERRLQQRKQAAQAAAMAQIEAFKPQAEFWDDVQTELRAEWAAAKAAGETPTIQDLYERACLRNKTVRPLYEQRKAAQAAASARATQPRTRTVSSSVRHEPTAPPSGAKPTSRREMLAELYDKQTR